MYSQIEKGGLVSNISVFSRSPASSRSHTTSSHDTSTLVGTTAIASHAA